MLCKPMNDLLPPHPKFYFNTDCSACHPDTKTKTKTKTFGAKCFNETTDFSDWNNQFLKPPSPARRWATTDFTFTTEPIFSRFNTYNICIVVSVTVFPRPLYQHEIMFNLAEKRLSSKRCGRIMSQNGRQKRSLRPFFAAML